MMAQNCNRFEWLKAVLQAEGLNSAAKIVASALAIQFANDATGQINPAIKTLAKYIKTSPDTVKRGVKGLVSGGWLGRTEGRGRGNKTTYRLCSPGTIITQRRAEKEANLPSKKVGNHAPFGRRKGATLREMGSNLAPSHIEQSSEQKTGIPEKWKHHRFDGNFADGPTYLSSKKHYEAVNAWGLWCKTQGLPALRSMPIAFEGRRGSTIFVVPTRKPPMSLTQEQQALSYFIELIEMENGSHVVQ